MTDTERLAIVEARTKLKAAAWVTRFTIKRRVRSAMTNGEFIAYARNHCPIGDQPS